MANQICTSKFTSVNTKNIPAIYNKIDWDKIRETFHNKKNFYVFDYGCGRSPKIIQDFMFNKGWHYFGYDPNWYEPFHLTFEGFDYVLREFGLGPDNLCVILTSNVLNVIDNEHEIWKIMNYCSSFPGVLYFHKIYQGDKSGVPKVTRKDCFQQNQPGKFYMHDYYDVVKGGEYITHRLFARFLK